MARHWTPTRRTVDGVGVNTGQIISGAGHFGLIGWALLGNIFASEPIPFEVTEVTAVTAEEYATIMAAERPPETVSDVIVPDVPDVPDDVPSLTSQVDTAADTSQPNATEAGQPDDVPELSEITPPSNTIVGDEAPVLQPPEEDFAALLPQTSLRPKQRPVKRIAPEQVAPPEPDTTIDEVVQQETVPDESSDKPAEETIETAPEEAATEIVTEAEQAAPAKSIRPKLRPSNASLPQSTAKDEETGSSDVEAALAAALGSSTDEPAQPSTPSGPPLTSSEKDALRISVQKCWNVGSLSSEALLTTVVVSVEMSESSTPVTSSIRLVSSTGGSSGAAKQAFAAARRAIIRCGARGFDLPREKYDHWREIEMTFNPEKMRIK